MVLPLILAFFVIVAIPVRAVPVAGNSATLISSNNIPADKLSPQKEHFIKKKAIRAVMDRYNSPMAESLEGFMNTCVKYDLNCYLLPSIAVLESTFGKFIYPHSYNAFGWGGGYIMFKNWDEGIDAVGKGLRENYINKGASSIEQIGKIYSESPTWSPRIRVIQSQFEKEEEKIQLYLENDAVEL